MIVHRTCFLPQLRSDQSVSQLNLFDFGHLTKHNPPDDPAPLILFFIKKRVASRIIMWQVKVSPQISVYVSVCTHYVAFFALIFSEDPQYKNGELLVTTVLMPPDRGVNLGLTPTSSTLLVTTKGVQKKKKNISGGCNLLLSKARDNQLLMETFKKLMNSWDSWVECLWNVYHMDVTACKPNAEAQIICTIYETT